MNHYLTLHVISLPVWQVAWIFKALHIFKNDIIIFTNLHFCIVKHICTRKSFDSMYVDASFFIYVISVIQVTYDKVCCGICTVKCTLKCKKKENK